jgi:D-lactate dehydrogenase (cytochrome)
MIQFQTQPSLLAGFLSDESGIAGQAEGICFPQTSDQVAQALALAHQEGKPVTVQGARTGYCGLAVPHGGYILNLSKMNRLLSFRFDPESLAASVTVQAGVTLDFLNQTLRARDPDLPWEDAASRECWKQYAACGQILFFPPNPTEGSASLGGILSTGASGAHVHAYGEIADQVSHIQRSCAGEASVITQYTAHLALKPPCACGLFAFGADYPALLHVLEQLETLAPESSCKIASAEIFDRSCFALIAQLRGRIPSLGQLPQFPSAAGAGLYLEIFAQDDEAVFSLLEGALTAMEQAGLQTDDTMVASTPQEIQRMQLVRHLLTEAANTCTFGQEKFTLERTLPPDQHTAYPALLTRLSAGIAHSGIPGFLLGHAGVGNFQLRLLPEDEAQAGAAAQLLRQAEEN